MRDEAVTLDIPHEELADFCSRRHIRRLAVFGSVLREDFRSDSDIDVLVEFDTGHVPRLIGFEGIAIELATLMGDHHVDLNTPGSSARTSVIECSMTRRTSMSERDNTVPLRHMLDYAREAAALTESRSRADLETDRLFNLAITRLVELIGEAANRVSAEDQQRLTGIPWAQIRGMRNRLIHGYDFVDHHVLCQTLTADLPLLIPALVGAFEA